MDDGLERFWFKQRSMAAVRAVRTSPEPTPIADWTTFGFHLLLRGKWGRDRDKVLTNPYTGQSAKRTAADNLTSAGMRTRQPPGELFPNPIIVVFCSLEFSPMHIHLHAVRSISFVSFNVFSIKNICSIEYSCQSSNLVYCYVRLLKPT